MYIKIMLQYEIKIIAVGHMVRPTEKIRTREWVAWLFGQQHHAQATLR